jgi:hypothetical protein
MLQKLHAEFFSTPAPALSKQTSEEPKVYQRPSNKKASANTSYMHAKLSLPVKFEIAGVMFADVISCCAEV